MPDGASQPDPGLVPLDPYIRAVERLRLGDYGVALPQDPADPLARLGDSLTALSQDLHRRYLESTRIESVTARMHAGLLLDEVLDGVYRDFRDLIPYQRIGVALLEEEGRILRARWARSEQLRILLGRGFAAPMQGSSLEEILRTGRPRILNDLHAYADAKPRSVSTQLVVEEGYRSSLTCPLIANGVSIGFVFFSSTDPGTYADVHVETFLRIAGQLATVVEKARHLSELAEQRELLERQNATLRELNEQKNRFLGIAAHALRNPIGNIRGIAELLQLEEYEPTPEERAAHLADIVAQASYMLTLLEDLLDVSQIEAGRLTLQPVPLDIGTLLREATTRFARSASAKGSRLRLASAPTATVVGDPLRLRQVLDNLVSNAIKYSPDGGTVHVSASNERGRVLLHVEDDGMGMTAADAERVFTRFFRSPAVREGSIPGAGLGLAITKAIVERHGGRISCRSHPGCGSTFTVELPAEAAAQDY